MPQAIDLHAHSVCSDGTDTPAQLLVQAQQAGLTVVGLTDHDTTAGWQAAAAAVPTAGVALVRGAEISCHQAGQSVHLLGYLFDPADEELNQIFARARADRHTRAERLVANLAADYELTWQDVAEQTAPGATIGRPHIADALVARGHFPNRAACFVSVLHPTSPYYVPHWAPAPAVAVAAVRHAGGVPVLAHPFANSRGPRLARETIADMVEAGLFGIEVDHRDHDVAARARAAEVAAEFGLVVFGGSDYHGTGKPNRLGENRTTPAVFARLAEEGRLEVVQP
ncbi:PHP domain-containing protein [Buchananella hordeovulneris]|uniref:PHP domain-containing protein n=1 Tax=Buchananella hordeovulneris TaxID=52770 RepID=UPI0026DBF054|nr:PHP domain-containing protein [Buchananella hordeovulneris]MDO5080700.1 PHP domain-containing protein [Buchananella hordeovulneris]